MSLLVDEHGHLMTYVVADLRAMTVLAAFNTVQGASRGLERLQAADAIRAPDLAFHNITHPKCPDWIKDYVRSDAAYCAKRAESFDRDAAALRRKAADLVAQAEQQERRAAEWRALPAPASAPAAPGM